jgi:hypothetical protein
LWWSDDKEVVVKAAHNLPIESYCELLL